MSTLDKILAIIQYRIENEELPKREESFLMFLLMMAKDLENA